jgi:Mu transposase, C-terminal
MNAVMNLDDDHLFDLECARQREAQRILHLLGELANQDYQYDRLRDRARRVGVPSQNLLAWWLSYREYGINGLIPSHWMPLDEASEEVVRERLVLLGELAETVEVTKEQILAIAPDEKLSDRTKMRLFLRYRIGGLWGLAPHYNPEKKLHSTRKKPPKRAAGTLYEAAFAEIDRRYQLVGEDLMNLVRIQGKASRQAVRERAIKMGCSEKTLWNYLADYREYGLQGLAPRERSDKGSSHIISPRMRTVIKGLLLPKRKRLSINKVHAEACKRARALGEPEPSKSQIRAISASIPKPDKLLAEGRENKFKSKYGITYSLDFLEELNPQIILEIDHTQIDVLAKDIRPPKYRTKSGEIRPWLTLCLERRSRLIMAAIFSYDRPDQYTVAAAIREAILVSDDKPYGGVPDIILVDNGKELLSHHIQHITQGLHIMLRPCIRHQPQQKGKVERMMGTLNTRLWSDQPGYVDSDVQKRNPHAKAELTIAQLEEKLRAFIAQYNNEVHSRLRGRTPLEYWHEHCFADPIDERDLDPLLMKKKTCTVHKFGIKYLTRIYWHRALADLVGKQVQVRSAPNYAPPDDIEVFDRDNWICTAFAIDSEVGKAITAKEVRDAQRDQREQAWERIREAREAVEHIDAEIVALQLDSQEKSVPPHSQTPQTSSDEVAPQEVRAPKEPKDTKDRPNNFLDVLSAHYEGQNQA